MMRQRTCTHKYVHTWITCRSNVLPEGNRQSVYCNVKESIAIHTCTLYVATVHHTGNINVTKYASRFVKRRTNLRRIRAQLRDHAIDAINFPKKKKNSKPFTSARIHRATMEVVFVTAAWVKSHCRISSEHSNGTTFCSLESFRAAVSTCTETE